jgi:hypothetical protein
MGVVEAKIQTVEDIYGLIWVAVANKTAYEGDLQRTSSAVLSP